LLVDLKGAKKVDYNSRQAGGRKIN